MLTRVIIFSEFSVGIFIPSGVESLRQRCHFVSLDVRRQPPTAGSRRHIPIKFRSRDRPRLRSAIFPEKRHASSRLLRSRSMPPAAPIPPQSGGAPVARDLPGAGSRQHGECVGNQRACQIPGKSQRPLVAGVTSPKIGNFFCKSIFFQLNGDHTSNWAVTSFFWR